MFIWLYPALCNSTLNIKIGKRNFGKVSVISGLDEGDIVISEGVSKVRDKGKIKIITPAK